MASNKTVSNHNFIKSFIGQKGNDVFNKMNIKSPAFVPAVGSLENNPQSQLSVDVKESNSLLSEQIIENKEISIDEVDLNLKDKLAKQQKQVK